MSVCGYFGKIPLERDFIFHGLPTRTMDAWADVMAAWMAASRAVERSRWSERYYSAPIWRFVVGRGQIDGECWLGIVAASVDAVGREFPFAVLISADLDLMKSQPIPFLDRLLDTLERPMLSFIEGDLGQDEFRNLIQAAAHQMQRGADGPGSSDASSIILPRSRDDGICLSYEKPEGGGLAIQSLHSLPSQNKDDPAGSPCLWWHDRDAGRPGEYCVTKSLPKVSNAAPYFLGNWGAHGWSPERLEDYFSETSD
ncbi:type VI secretion system-associated protein TagF [Roseibium polysiphoniae]|uniref:Type VI secretion system-associated protein TagF n=1 Tax=Roseibium polysiphoniae TaxID=2571221 RepID=A0ABR9CA02_9HYPH|nr:type VI secretion system-associated protein TagF [Roseibium polysiphoniae]MBD8876705.1 type VI secretion system-associated protein TagF [Roseibium polysiphoniae]